MHEIDRLYEFLKNRISQSTDKICLANVLQIGGGEANYCLTNAEDRASSLGYGVVSGWLALPSKIQGNDWQKQFTQHWWNYDWNHREHLDFSPNIEEGAIYIQDDEIIKFVCNNNQNLNSHVASSIIMKKNMFYGVDYGENGFRFHDIDELSINRIFFFQKSDCINASNIYI
jgi:hypothetical protein